MLRYPDISPIALSLGPVQIHWYGIMYVVAFGVAWWLARRQAARPGSTWKADDVDDFIFWCMVGVIVGGRVGYVLIYVLDETHQQVACVDEEIFLHIDLETRRTAPWPEDVASRLDARIAEHAGLPFPADTSGSLALR